MIKNKIKIIIIDDDDKFQTFASEILTDAGYECIIARDRKDSLIKLEEPGETGILIIDTKISKAAGNDFLNQIIRLSPETVIIMLASYHDYEDFENAADALETGVSFFIIKPIEQDQFLSVINNAASFYKIKNDLTTENGEIQNKELYNDIIGNSSTIRNIFSQIDNLIDKELNILITGESGTGKELLARAIHKGSRRREGPFIVVNCASITAEIAESLLFGHKKGAFTGAANDHTGYFQQAHNGTIFLDEIGDMNIDIQAKVLRAIEEKKVLPVGGKQYIDTDFRIVSATNRDLSDAIIKNKFRSDLYYRLEQYPIRMPTLRERKEDIPLLVRHFLKDFSEIYKTDPSECSDEALGTLIEHNWPGNIRELKNVIYRSVIQCKNSYISEFLLYDINESEYVSAVPMNEQAEKIDRREQQGEEKVIPLEEMERKAIINAYMQTGQNVDKAAKLLGIGRTTLYRKLKKYSIIT